MFSLLNNQTSGGFAQKYLQRHQPSLFQVAKDALLGRDEKTGVFYDETKSKCLLFRGTLLNSEDLSSLLEDENENENEHIILLLYKRFGIKKTLELIDGQYAFFLYDNNSNNEHLDCTEKFYVARDPFGQIPLYQITCEDNDDCMLGFAMDMESLMPFVDHEVIPPRYNIVETLKGTCTTLELSFKVLSSWKITKPSEPFHHFPKIVYQQNHLSDKEHDLRIQGAHCAMEEAIRKCVLLSATHSYGCLLSGGVYSSIVAALLNDHIRTIATSSSEPPPVLHTFHVSYKGQNNTKEAGHARQMAAYIYSEHHEIVIDDGVRDGDGDDDLFDIVYRHIEELGIPIQSLFYGTGARQLATKRRFDQGWVEYEDAIRSGLHNLILPKPILLPIPMFSPFLDLSFVESFLHIPTQTRSPHANQHFMQILFWSGYYLNKNKKPLLPYSVMWQNVFKMPDEGELELEA